MTEIFISKPRGELGKIVASMLSETEFIKSDGGKNYVLADGRKLALDEPYAKFIDNYIPDLRGVFLRGKAYGRERASGNAAGDLSLGAFQRSSFESHAHEYWAMILNNEIDGIDSELPHSNEHNVRSGTTSIQEVVTSEETRPKSVTVNYFICIR